MYYRIETDMILSVEGDKEKILDAILDALNEVTEKHGGELAGSVDLVPTTEEELMEELSRAERQLFTEYKSGRDFIKAAEKSPNVVSIRQGKGDHVIVRAEGQAPISVPMHRELAPGTR